MHAADMSDPAAIAEMIGAGRGRLRGARHARQQCRHPVRQPAGEFPPAKWDAVLAINLSSAFHTTRLALDGMRRRGRGRIINVASAHGLVGLSLQVGLCRRQAWPARPHQGAALETAEAGITCNAICPGYVWTPLVEAQIEDQASSHGIPREEVIRDVLLAQQPNKRFATVEEIGALAVFLAATRPPPSPARRCPSTAAGPPTDGSRPSRSRTHDHRDPAGQYPITASRLGARPDAAL